VIVGKDVALMEQILRVLTYFIRCSELAENTEVCPLLTADIDDTTTLMSVSDIATTPVTCLAVDVTLSSSDSLSTSVSPVSREKPQFTAADSSHSFLLKPPSSSSIRSMRVHFENGDTAASECSTETSKSTDPSAVFSEPAASSTSEVTTSVTMEQSLPLGTDGQAVPKPLVCFRMDVSDSLPPLLGLTCSGCDFSQPCHDCSERLKNSKLNGLGQRDGDIPLIDNSKSSLCRASDMPADCSVRTTAFTDGEKNFPFSNVPKPCQLSLVEAIENVRVERVAHVRREPTEESRPNLHRVPLEKPAITSANACLGRTDHLPAKLSAVPPYMRSNSMFDEYFDGSSVMDLRVSASGRSAFPFGIDIFDEIMNEAEPCPDVSHIDVSQLSSGSSSSEMVPDPLPASDDTIPQSAGGLKMVPDSRTSAAPSSLSPATFNNVFLEQHFAVAKSEEHLDDIPDGPSKQMISSAIKLMQDVCSDHTSQASVDDLADIPVSEYFSQTGLGPPRGRQRHPSGQSNTSARCR